MPRKKKKPSEKDTYTPSFLAAWREHRDMTQEEAAPLIGVDRAHLGKIERGLVPYSQGVLEAAAKAYNCDPADLLMRNPKAGMPSIFDEIRKLSPRQQRQIMGMIKGFIEGSEEAA